MVDALFTGISIQPVHMLIPAPAVNGQTSGRVCTLFSLILLVFVALRRMSRGRVDYCTSGLALRSLCRCGRPQRLDLVAASCLDAQLSFSWSNEAISTLVKLSVRLCSMAR